MLSNLMNIVRAFSPGRPSTSMTQVVVKNLCDIWPWHKPIKVAGYQKEYDPECFYKNYLAHGSRLET